MYQKRDLYGGAIVTKTVSDLIDASDIRQIPDYQEVFMYPDSDVNIIVEVLEMVEPPQLEDAIKSHFSTLAKDNSAETSTVEQIATQITSGHKDTPPPILLQGVQTIRKFNGSELDTVRIYMGLFRIEEKNVDLLVTFNVPLVSQDGSATNVIGQERAEADFKMFVESLAIENFGLFV